MKSGTSTAGTKTVFVSRTRMIFDTANDELWLFGGWGTDAAGQKGYLADVWRYVYSEH